MNNIRLPYRILRSWIKVDPHELPGLLLAFTCAMMMFTAYSMLRPIRDAMGSTSGLKSLPWLVWATFGVTLLLQPLYGWLLSRFAREHVLPGIYRFVGISLILFYGWFHLQSDHTWIARTYFVWVSVFNLFITGVFWSLMAEVFNREQAARLYGFIAGGLSAGGLLGPLLAVWLAKPLGTISLLLIAAGFFFIAAGLMHQILIWQAAQPQGLLESQSQMPLKAKPWDAFQQVIKSRYLSLIALFVVLLTFVSTILYLEQQRLVTSLVSDRDAQTNLFATIDFYVQAGSLILQIFLFPALLRLFNFRSLLAMIPAVMLVTFFAFTITPTLPVIIGAMMIRRIGEYGITRPCRDMLFTVVTPQEKYMAKSLIDTFIYRGGDAISASLYAAITAFAASASLGTTAPAWFGVIIAGLWVGVSVWLAKMFILERQQA